jgi:hypothetical protein
MVSNDAQPTQQADYSFIILVFSLAGWALLEAWAIIVGASWYAHALNALPGSILTVLALPRASAGAPGKAGGANPASRGFARALLPALFLFVLGAFLGMLFLSGALLLFGLLAACLCLAPWSRLAFARDHVLLCSALTLSGLFLPIALAYQDLNTMLLPLGCWVFWLCACCALLVRTDKRRRAERRAKAGRDDVATQPAAAES